MEVKVSVTFRLITSAIVKLWWGVLIGATAASGAGFDCPQLDGASIQAHVEYLRGERATLNDACILKALEKLATPRYGPSIKVLVEYLDYQVPDPPTNKEASMQHTMPWLGTRYTAAKGLLAMGRATIPALVDVIGESTTPELLRKNATQLLVLIHGGETTEGAAVLNRAARSSTVPEVRQRLYDAARELCPAPERGACLSDADAHCPQLDGASVQAQVDYLQGERTTLKEACIVSALKKLAAARYGPSIKVLVKYLDYRVPEPPRSAEAFVQSPLPSPGISYPAINGLLAIGRPAVADLADAIGNGSYSERLHKNAIELVLLIYRDEVPEGVAVLNRAAHSAGAPDVRQRLYDAARELANKCLERERGACLSNALQ